MKQQSFSKDQLQAFDEQLTSMIAVADSCGDHLLGALLCDVLACVMRRYADLEKT